MAANSRTLEEISENKFSVKIYLIPLELDISLVDPIQKAIGLRRYPKVDDSSPSGEAKIYRYIGTDKTNLNCDSTMIISTNLNPTPENFSCNGEDVFSLLIPAVDQVPYIDLTYGTSLLNDIEVFGERRRLSIGNHASIDLWVEWFRDVHQDYALDFLPHGSNKERKSRKVDISAFFPIKIYKNNNGQKGEYLGEFTREVYFYDHIELAVITIDNKNYLQAISTIELPGKILLSVLL